MHQRSYITNKYGRKRPSHDSVREQRSHNSFKAAKKGMAEISIDLQTKKNLLSLNCSQHNSHRQRNHETNLSELREEVEQLRMENQCLREELKLLKENENNLNYQIKKVKEEFSSQRREFRRKLVEMEDKNNKYASKIKELFETLIEEKKKKVGLNDSAKLNLVFSPSSKSANSYKFPFHQYEKQGELDYYKSIEQNHRFGYQSNKLEEYPSENDERVNIYHSQGGYVGGETFGTIH